MSTSAVLTLSQWLSPSYPLGSFAYSHGLEAAIAEGWVDDRDTLRAWLRDVLTDGSGWADAVLFCAAYRATDAKALMQVDATGRAFAASHERLRESVNQGAAFARTLAATSQVDVPPVLFPVAVGWATAQQSAPLQMSASMYLQAFVSNIVMACLRLMPLGQTDGQALIQDLSVLCEKTARAASTTTLDDLHSNTFLSDIAAMRHEVQQPRLFQS
ncbi:urease accessory protein UreF [Yoonia sp. F2084L]|uniref:urease accessory protein UreF n=1 Tax=Yoonia sp. F2084L TaxID=2926419 RepID=UPI001FF1766C|nr:urease accessory UreF family protein [Yoonia sp. F2084L]MCK0094862.1 urease accessory protein UreF [Yoonia sp. F2084L]